MAIYIIARSKNPVLLNYSFYLNIGGATFKSPCGKLFQVDFMESSFSFEQDGIYIVADMRLKDEDFSIYKEENLRNGFTETQLNKGLLLSSELVDVFLEGEDENDKANYTEFKIIEWTNIANVNQ